MNDLHMGTDVAPVMGAAAEELRWFWNDQEADVGFRSYHGEAVNKQAGLTVDTRTYALEAEEVLDSPVGWRTWATRAALKSLSPEQVQVLYAAFGPRNPAARTDVLDELTARVAPYTPLVEEARLSMIQGRVAAMTSAALADMELRRERRDTVVAAATARRRRAEAALRELGRRHDRAIDLAVQARRAALAKEVVSAVRALEQASRGVLDDEAMRRVAQSYERAAVLQIGWADALTYLLGPRLTREEGESAAAFEFRRGRWFDCRGYEAQQLQTQARTVLYGALRAYREAREKVG